MKYFSELAHKEKDMYIAKIISEASSMVRIPSVQQTETEMENP